MNNRYARLALIIGYGQRVEKETRPINYQRPASSSSSSSGRSSSSSLRSRLQVTAASRTLTSRLELEPAPLVASPKWRLGAC